jgi:ABC-type branched-subunit amino acid transport system ATPase component
MTDPEIRLACSEVTVRFGGLVAVDKVSLEVPTGAIVGLVGPNGAGKSTLFGVLSGLTRPTAGSVTIDGQDVTGFSPQQRARLGLARTFQHPELYAGLSVRDHLVLSYRAHAQRRRTWSDLVCLGSLHRPAPEETQIVDGLVGLIGLGDVADRLAAGMPLGTARLVELGRALAGMPRVLLLDEPSSGLDSTESERFEQTLLRVAREQSTSILMVEHDVEMVMRMSSQVNVLDFGSLISHGTPEQVRADPAVRAAYLGVEDEAEVETAAPAPKARVRVAKPAPVPETEQMTAPALLDVSGLCVQYGDAFALNDVTFSLPRGKAMAVLGPNGAGKSSLVRALSGLVTPTAGRITLDGTDVSTASPNRFRNLGVIHLPEGRGVFRSLTVAENLKMAAVAVPGGRGARQETIDRAIELFPQLSGRSRQVAGRLSGGEQQMLSLARALSTDPQLVIADELSLGLAPKLVDIVFEALEKLRARGTTIVAVEQYVHRALAFADECLVLSRGSVVWRGPAAAAGPEVLRHYIGEGMSVGA